MDLVVALTGVFLAVVVIIMGLVLVPAIRDFSRGNTIALPCFMLCAMSYGTGCKFSFYFLEFSADDGYCLKLFR